MRRVVITGIGAVTPLGLDAVATYRAACEGKCGIGPFTLPDRDDYPHPLKQKIAGQIRDFDPAAHISETDIALFDRSAQFNILAAREAVADAGITFDGELAERTAVITGTGIGGIESIDNNAWRVYFEQKPRVHPFSVPRTMPSASASHISMEFNIQGPAFTVSSACSSAAHAIGEAYTMVKSGRADAAVTGGTEAPLTLGSLVAWQALRVMSNTGCRPFSRDRNGMVLGEGAGIVVFEELEAAKRRGARIYAEVAGYGLSADAGDIVDPSPEGCARAVRQAVREAELNPETIGYINAHGTATVANDRTETAALKLALGDGARDIWISSTKSMHGHALGGTAAMEFVLAVQALANGVLPPTVNMAEPDPECDLRHVQNTAVEAKVDAVLSNSFAFGGLNAVLAVRRFA